MEQNEIIEGNKLIAEFMGLPLGSAKGRELFGSDRVKKAVYIGLRKSGVVGYSDAYWISWVNPIQCQYHTSWDWLMPVVEKIEHIGEHHDYCFNILIEVYSCKINKYTDGQKDESFEIHYYQGESKINATWNAVVDFIKWYNSTHPSAPKA